MKVLFVLTLVFFLGSCKSEIKKSIPVTQEGKYFKSILQFIFGDNSKILEPVTLGKIFDVFWILPNNGKYLAFSSNRNNGGVRNTNLFIAEWP